jgi:ubiquinone/menaquinone biosynthesis C-methylase UbiE
MRPQYWMLLLAACGSSQAVSPDPASAPAANSVAAPEPEPSALPPANPPAVAPATSSAGGAPSPTTASSTAPAPGDEHNHGHAHGKAGYHMDFSAVERFAKHFDGPARDAWQKPIEVVRFLEIATGQTVADIGAGTGYFVSYLSKAVGESGRVLALDVEPNMVEYAKQRSKKANLANVEAKVVSPEDPGLAPSSVDRIVIVNTWHHIDDRSNYAAKLGRALKPQGALLIVDFTLDADMGPPKEHRLSAEQVIKELEGGGLSAEMVKGETLPKQYLVRAKVKTPSR